MSRIERGFYPLSQIEEQGVPKIEMNLNLPDYVDKDQIGVNVKGIYQMMRVGGIKTLHVAGQAGETSSYTPHIVGRDENGTAIAGRTGIEKKVPTHSASNNNQESNGVFQAQWTDAQVNINLSEMTTRLSEKGKVRSSNAWAKEIDSAMRQGISESGRAHLIFGPSRANLVRGGLGTGIGTLLGMDGSFAKVELSPIGDSATSIVYINTCLNGADRYVHKRSGNQSDFRWSLFNGPQLDRAVALKAMSKTKRLVKEIK